MESVAAKPAKLKHSYLLLATFLITNFLFFIDEGYFNLNWMKHWGNWVMFGIYFLFIYLGQFAFTALAWRFDRTPLAYLFGITMGTFLGAGGLILILLS